MAIYAKQTTVSPEKSRAEIEAILADWTNARSQSAWA